MHLSVSTLADCVAAVDDSVAPLASRIREIVLACHLLQADDTSLKVLDKDAPGDGATAIDVGCWAHARRSSVELVNSGDARAAVLVEMVQRLYAVESKATEVGVDHETRRALGEQYSKPVLMEIGRWCAARQAITLSETTRPLLRGLPRCCSPTLPTPFGLLTV